MELKGKVIASVMAGAAPVAAPAKKDDGLSLALAQLGYKRSEIEAALAHLEELGKAEAPLAERIQLSLKRLSRG